MPDDSHNGGEGYVAGIGHVIEGTRLRTVYFCHGAGRVTRRMIRFLAVIFFRSVTVKYKNNKGNYVNEVSGSILPNLTFIILSNTKSK